MIYPWQTTVQDDNGNAVVSPVVTVYNSSGGLAVVYNESGVAISNPLAGSIDGFVQFWVADGKYDIVGSKGGANTKEWSFVAGGSVRFDEAQSLTTQQKVNSRSNIGLGSATDASTALGIISARRDSDYNIADFVSLNGQVWRILSHTIAKASSGTDTLIVNYPQQFIDSPYPVITNGDSLAIDNAIFSVFNATSSSFSVSARNLSGAPFTGSYRINYNVFGRIS